MNDLQEDWGSSVCALRLGQGQGRLGRRYYEEIGPPTARKDDGDMQAYRSKGRKDSDGGNMRRMQSVQILGSSCLGADRNGELHRYAGKDGGKRCSLCGIL